MRNVLLSAVLFLAGCGWINPSLLPEQSVDMQIRNATDHSVTFTLYIGDDDLTERDLKDEGEQVSSYLFPGEQTLIRRSCRDVQSILLEAKMDIVDIIAGFGPHADSGVIRDDEDFDCGETVWFELSSTVSRGFDMDVWTTR